MRITKTRLAAAIIAACLMFLWPAMVCVAADAEQVIKVTAKKFEYNPNTITVKKGIPVVLEFTSLDRLHGFSCPGLGIRSDIAPGKVISLRFVPQKAGTYPFHCDNFCGSGHEGMTGTIIVQE